MSVLVLDRPRLAPVFGLRTRHTRASRGVGGAIRMSEREERELHRRMCEIAQPCTRREVEGNVVAMPRRAMRGFTRT